MASMADVKDYLKSQLCTKLPVPDKLFTGQTIIVTGSNVGMGLEAARYFVRLDAKKVILAVRTISKGETAKKSIEESEKRMDVVTVWELNLSSYASVKEFASKAQSLERLDVLMENAGMYTFDFEMAEDNERTITVNVVSTFLLAFLLLPKLRETAVAVKKPSVLNFTGSFVHKLTKFPERETEHIFSGLAKKGSARMNDRYNISKLIGLLCYRQLANEITHSTYEGKVIVNLANPGFVDTSIMREASFFYSLYISALKKIMSRTAEEGGRVLVDAAEGGDETHGAYLDDCKPGKVSPFVASEEGGRIQKKLWRELLDKLEEIQPGITQNIYN